jgi:hypothetical protein
MAPARLRPKALAASAVTATPSASAEGNPFPGPAAVAAEGRAADGQAVGLGEHEPQLPTGAPPHAHVPVEPWFQRIAHIGRKPDFVADNTQDARVTGRDGSVDSHGHGPAR